MNTQSVLKSTGRIALATILWLCVQLCVILAIEHLRLLPTYLLGVSIYCAQGLLYSLLYTISCCLVGLVYTTVGCIILDTVPINTKRWWLIVGMCFAIYMILTAVLMVYFQGPWFWEGYGAYLLDVWLAPFLWLGEIELYHLIKRNLKPDKA